MSMTSLCTPMYVRPVGILNYFVTFCGIFISFHFKKRTATIAAFPIYDFQVLRYFLKFEKNCKCYRTSNYDKKPSCC